jgi:hypothetical protein
VLVASGAEPRSPAGAPADLGLLPSVFTISPDELMASV